MQRKLVPARHVALVRDRRLWHRTAMALNRLIDGLDPARPVLIAGPTASGKSDLALAIAVAQGRMVVNADALQVFGCWRILTARPGEAALAAAPHRLYGHLPHDAAYSVGDWLREVARLPLAAPAPVIVGGSGLYLSALTEGLAAIPATDPAVRARADALRARAGTAPMIAALDPGTRARIDLRNPMRVQRAWEVLEQTGRGLAAWQDETGPPLIPRGAAHALLLDADKGWLDVRIAARFDAMMAEGALDEVRRMRDRYDPAHLSARAIGAPELIAHLDGALSESEAVAQAKAASRRYAKRQRTWFRARMRDWCRLDAAELCGEIGQHLKMRR